MLKLKNAVEHVYNKKMPKQFILVDVVLENANLLKTCKMPDNLIKYISSTEP